MPVAAIKFPQFLPPYARANAMLVVPKLPAESVTLPVGVVTPWPERVVALMTRLVLSPYSAGGAPSITSSDCTAADGTWLEKTLLCWSVMGWPSIEKEFSAWSPRPWIWPSESAETPGDACVTIELKPEDRLSIGMRS